MTQSPVHVLAAAYRRWRDRRILSKEAARLARADGLFFSRDPVGFKADVWREHLARVAGRPGLRLLEIGCLEGKSAIWFCQHVLTDPASRLTCVDPWHPLVKLRFDHNIRTAGIADRIRVIQKPSAEALTEDLVGERFDLIYIDGNHNAPFVLFDAFFAWPLLEDGGLLLFDDYGWRPDLPDAERPKPAIDFFLENHDGQYRLIHKAHQVIICKQTP